MRFFMASPTNPGSMGESNNVALRMIEMAASEYENAFTISSRKSIQRRAHWLA